MTGTARGSLESPPARSADRVLHDYRVAYESRQASLIGRKEVFSGKAKFGIFGDGKEIAQIAMASVFEPGDFRSGYYRDQTFMLALELTTLEEFFAQLYAHADLEAEPSSAGRSMTAHFSTRSLDADGNWVSLTDRCNSSADLSPTGSQMPRLVGLGQASVVYRQLGLDGFEEFSRDGREVAFGTIGNASCAEGLFWESVNAIGVLKAPVVLSVWDDHYGISVPNEYQITKSNISDVLSGFQRDGEGEAGYEIVRVMGWDYPALLEAYARAARIAREEHVPVLVHVQELTQPQGHSTSGSHERYKSPERLTWEEDFDGLRKMRLWIESEGLATAADLDALEEAALARVHEAKASAWSAFTAPIASERDGLMKHLESLAAHSAARDAISAIVHTVNQIPTPIRRDLARAAHDAIVATRAEDTDARNSLKDWLGNYQAEQRDRYSSHLHSQSASAALDVPVVPAVLGDEELRGFEVLNRCFDAALARMPNLIAFGEDVGQLGDVNQGFMGLQEKYGEARVSDAGIREATLLGQAIGLAMRGIRPIVEIQYLDYILYALQILSDDLATLQYRTRGGQKAPVIVRTRGHRLEGIWHAGSPMAGIIHLVRGIYVCVPRDMTQAAGFYNTLLASDDAGIIVEVLNGYRLRERVPTNIDTFTVPLGVPEVLRGGSDVTVVTYGACCRIALEAAAQLAELGIEIEVIDVQTLLPFDTEARIVESLQKTNRIVFLDEDVPGGTTAYLMQQVLEGQGGYDWLDSSPVTLSAQPHRPAYGSDGDYWSKPNREDIVRAVYAIMHEFAPARFPEIF